MTFISQTSVPVPAEELVLSGQVCDASVSIGNWVRWNGSTLINASADNLPDSNVFGLVESKSSSTLCNVRIFGISDPIFTGLDNSKEYFLSDSIPGGMVPQGVGVPTASGSVLLKLGKPVDTQRFFVNQGTRIIRS